MSLQGQLSDLPLHSVIQNLAANQCTGLLTLRKETTDLGMLFFVNGTITAFYSMRIQSINWSQLLVASETTPRNKLEDAELTNIPADQFPEKAVAAGVISTEELNRVFYSFVQEEIFDLFRLQSGEFIFEHTENVPDFFIYQELFGHLTFNITHLLMEGARQSDEWKRLTRVIDSPMVIFKKTGNTAETQDIQVILDLVDGNRNLLDLIDQSHLPKINAVTAITDALQKDLIREATPDEIRKDIETLRSAKNNTLERIKKIAYLRNSSHISTEEKEKLQKELDEILLRSNLEFLNPHLIRMQIQTDHIRQAKARQKANTRKKLLGLAALLILSIIGFVIHTIAIQPEDNSAASILSTGKSLEKQNPAEALRFYMKKLSCVKETDAQELQNRIAVLSKNVQNRFRAIVSKLKSLAGKGDAENVNSLLDTVNREYEGIVPANKITAVHEQVKKLLDKQTQISEKKKINQFVEEIKLLIQAKKYLEARNRILKSGYSTEAAVDNLNKAIQSVEQQLEACITNASKYMKKEMLVSARKKAQTLYQSYLKAEKAGSVQQAFSLAREIQIKYPASSVADKAVPIILVSSVPAGAAVSVNGKRVGLTPAKAQLTPEKTIITVTKDGFRLWKKTLNLATCTSAEYNARLVKKPVWEKPIGTITTFPVIHNLKYALASFGIDIKCIDLEKGSVRWTNTINRSATSFIDEHGKKHLISESAFWHTQGRSLRFGHSFYVPSLNNRHSAGQELKELCFQQVTNSTG